MIREFNMTLYGDKLTWHNYNKEGKYVNEHFITPEEKAKKIIEDAESEAWWLDVEKQYWLQEMEKIEHEMNRLIK